MAPLALRLHSLLSAAKREQRNGQCRDRFFPRPYNDRENCKTARSSIRSDTMENQATFPYPGAIDADGHILEPPDTWERYIDPKFRDRAIRLRSGKSGLEVLEIDGRPSKFMAPGS